MNVNVSQRLNKDYSSTTVTWSNNNPGDVQLGERIVQVRNGCIDCHGTNLAGKKVMDNPAMGKMYGSNITPAALKDWNDPEIARATRHGIGRDGKPLVLMPSHDYINLSENDLKAVIAYLRNLPAVEQSNVPIAMGPVAKILLVTGKAATLVPAEVINHQQPFTHKPAEAATVNVPPKFSGSGVSVTSSSKSVATLLSEDLKTVAVRVKVSSTLYTSLLVDTER